MQTVQVTSFWATGTSATLIFPSAEVGEELEFIYRRIKCVLCEVSAPKGKIKAWRSADS